jgi:von Willebrand factor type A domain
MRRLVIFAFCVPVLTLALGGLAAPAQATLAPTDVMFLFDTSGSMESALGEAQAEMQEVMSHLNESIASVQLGVAEVKDTGEEEEEEEEEGLYAWKLDQSLTSNTASVSEAIEALSAYGGGDAPEAYGRALYETDTNPSVGWRATARHVIVLIADEVPHMPDVNEGVDEAFWLQNPFDTGEELEAQAGIARTQWHPGVNIQFMEDLKRLVADEKPLEMVDYHSTSENYIHYWEYWAGLGGGSAVEASEGGKELATQLIGLVERAGVQCATSATPGEPSPGSNGLPTALTPRFRQPGSRVTVTTSASSPFCPEDSVQLGDAKDSAFEEATPTKRVFRVPPEASSGLGLAGPSGLRAPEASYAVDNFREPWGFAISNTPGNGDQYSYDSNIPITRQDLETVFTGLGGPGTPAYREAERDAKKVLSGGLCYGFSLVSWELYLDSHGNTLPLGWSNWSGSTLTRGQLPINIPEEGGGSHALTHALMRAAVTQYSPEQEKRETIAHSAAELASILNAGFAKGQPVPIAITWKEGGFLGIGAKEEGHSLLAYNYQPASDGGIDVDVVDPNLTAKISPQTLAYPNMQVHVHPDSSWNYAGTFNTSTPYGNPVSGESRSIHAAVDPRVPGGLNIPANVKHWWDIFSASGGGIVSSISYSATAAHGFPSDIKSQADFADTFSQRLLVPPSHHVITATIDGSAGASIALTGPGFIDAAMLGAGTHLVTLHSADGALSVPLATSKTTLSVTRVTHGVQYTVDAKFLGTVKHPTIEISPAGAIFITTAGGRGSVSLRTGTYLPSGRRAVSRHSRTRLHGRAHIHRHTPKIKVKRHKRRGHKRKRHKGRKGRKGR